MPFEDEDPYVQNKHPEEADAGEHGADREKIMGVILGGSIAEALVGAFVVVLAIIGLLNLRPEQMASIATIAVGAALLFQGGMIEARASRLAEMSGTAEAGRGVSAEILGGSAGIILGILAWIGIAPAVMIPFAVILLGGALLLGGSALSRLGLVSFGNLSERMLAFTRRAVEAASGTEVLVGAAVVVLGLVALLGVAPWRLMLVSLLALGAAELLSGSAVASRIRGVVHRRGMFKRA
jgi:hypothetical protein